MTPDSTATRMANAPARQQFRGKWTLTGASSVVCLWALFGHGAMSDLSPFCTPKRTFATALVYGFTPQIIAKFIPSPPLHSAPGRIIAPAPGGRLRPAGWWRLRSPWRRGRGIHRAQGPAAADREILPPAFPDSA